MVRDPNYFGRHVAAQAALRANAFLGWIRLSAEWSQRSARSGAGSIDGQPLCHRAADEREAWVSAEDGFAIPRVMDEEVLVADADDAAVARAAPAFATHEQRRVELLVGAFAALRARATPVAYAVV